MSRKCKWCNVLMNGTGWHEHNIKLHENNCKKKVSGKQPTLSSFCKTKSIASSNLLSGTIRENINEPSDSSNPNSNQNSDTEDFIVVDSRDIEVDNLSLDFSQITHNNLRHKNKRKKDNTTIETVNETVVNQKAFNKCIGFKLNIEIYTQFPFQRFELDELDFVFENGCLHSNLCFKHNYELIEQSTNNNQINVSCFQIQYNNKYRKICERIVSCEDHTNYEYLNYQQLVEKILDKNEKINDLKLKCITKDLSLISSRNRTTILERFKQLIANEDINRIRQLVSVCMKEGRSTKAIINKINLATSNLYKPKQWNENDLDLAILVLRVGGPSLLHVFSTMNRLPTSSYIYKITKSEISINYSFNLKIYEVIEQNIQQFFQNVNGYYSIKLDEIATTPRLRWCPKTNEFVGFCFNHKEKIENITFDDIFSLLSISRLYQNNEIHLAKEALCVTICKIDSSDIMPYPICIIPVCCHTLPELKELLLNIFNVFRKLNPNANIVNLATDGDHYRRNLINRLKNLPINENVLKFFKTMKYFPCSMLFGSLTVNYDAKHLIKRIRGILISESRSITLIKRQVTKKHLETMFPSLKRYLNPHDYQNVPYAVDLLISLCDKNLYESLPATHLFSTEIVPELKLFGELVKAILNIFHNPKTSLVEQLSQLACCAHLLLFIYRKQRGAFMPKQLYMDLQCTIQDAFYISYLFISNKSKDNVYLYQCGTDQIETLFSTIRTLTHSKNADVYELLLRLKTALSINTIKNKHPDWNKNTRISHKSTNDYSSIRDWVGNLSTYGLTENSLKFIWMEGLNLALETLKSYGYNNCDLTINADDVDTLNPFGNKTNYDEVDENVEESTSATQSTDFDNSEHFDLNDNMVEEIQTNISLETVTTTNYSAYVEFKGESIHKSNAISNIINNTSKLSTVRNIRVFASDQNVVLNFDEEVEIDESKLFLTDILATVLMNKVDNNLFVGLFSIDKIVMCLNSVGSACIDRINECKFNGSLLILEECKEDDSIVLWPGSYGDQIKEVNGLFCCNLKFDLKINDSVRRTISKLELIRIRDYFQDLIRIQNLFKFPLVKYSERSFTYKSLILKSKEFHRESSSQFKCEICEKLKKIGKLLTKDRMRQHIGKHILNKETLQNQSICGFCGTLGCSIALKVTSGYGKNKTEGADSNCKFFVKFNLQHAINSTDRSPCTNRPVACIQCKQVVWSYNIGFHYKESHPGIDMTETCFPNELEIKNVLSLKV